jgi:hypothetical protein
VFFVFFNQEPEINQFNAILEKHEVQPETETSLDSLFLMNYETLDAMAEELSKADFSKYPQAEYITNKIIAVKTARKDEAIEDYIKDTLMEPMCPRLFIFEEKAKNLEESYAAMKKINKNPYEQKDFEVTPTMLEQIKKLAEEANIFYEEMKEICEKST